MSIDLSRASDIAGFLGACLFDGDTGLMLTSQGGGGVDLEAAAMLSSEAVKAQLAVAEGLGLGRSVEEVVATFGQHIHIVTPLSHLPGTYLFVMLDRSKAKLGMARLQLRALEQSLTI
ncbi:MAG: roadblock/LC7 domain-containing protein [Rhodobacteraceae bacterium]|nr:roadblock/LC7 domain-containing protein [Paracoccaceae bacterium]